MAMRTRGKYNGEYGGMHGEYIGENDARCGEGEEGASDIGGCIEVFDMRRSITTSCWSGAPSSTSCELSTARRSNAPWRARTARRATAKTLGFETGLLEGYCDETDWEDDILAIDCTTAAQGHRLTQDDIQIVSRWTLGSGTRCASWTPNSRLVLTFTVARDMRFESFARDYVP